MKRKQGAAVLIIMIVVIVLLGYYSFGILKGTAAKDSSRGIRLGLDLAGGVSITYQVEGDETPSAEDMSDTINKLENRVYTYSTEADVYQVGDDRIAVEIPGATNADEIFETIGTPGTLEFRTDDGETFMTGDYVVDAQAGTNTDSTTGNLEYIVELTLNDEGAEIFSEVTGENVGNNLPIYFDDELVSNPEVKQQISGGIAQISGMDSYEDAEALASTIRSGALTLELEEIQSEVVGAKLGTQAIDTSIIAAFIGILIIIVFMIIAYRIPGLAAALALLIYSGLVLAILHWYHVTLTLPGIAGIILSVGMAVDANVVIFARIREEISLGKSVNTSVDVGFKKALSAILDGNITTLIAAAVLGVLGSGSVRGFAATLAIGIVFSMFSALLITRLIIKGFYGLGIRDKKFYGEKKEREPINFIGRRRIFFVISAVVIVIGFIGMGTFKSGGSRALNFSLEFLGGTSTTVTFEEEYTLEEIDDEIVPLIEKITGDGNVQVQTVENSTDVVFKTRTLDKDERAEFNSAMEENFGVGETDITSSNISSTISSEMRANAIRAVIVATILMLIYIWIRFRDSRFAVAAVIPLIHDVLIVLTFYALSRTSVGTTFIACMLTLVGYSVNATIVVFDRIRENQKELGARYTADDLRIAANKSVTQTLSRSINTSLTTFIMVLVLFILGVSSIREFAGPLMVGVICGGYSSVCISSALWYLFKTRIGKNRIREGEEPRGGRRKPAAKAAGAGDKSK